MARDVRQPFGDVVRRTIELANSRVFARGAASEAGLSMGTTTTAIALAENSCVIGHVGDTRAYRVGPEMLDLLTDDHTFTAEAIRDGRLTEEDASRSPFVGQLTRTVGTKAHVDPDVVSVPAEPGSAFLLCSDGLTGVVSDGQTAHE